MGRASRFRHLGHRTVVFRNLLDLILNRCFFNFDREFVLGGFLCPNWLSYWGRGECRLIFTAQG